MATLAAGLFIGALIRYKGAISLIAGFDLERIGDEEGLSEFIGMNAIYVAVLTIIIGLIEYSQFQSTIYWYIYTAAVVIFALKMMIGVRNYK